MIGNSYNDLELYFLKNNWKDGENNDCWFYRTFDSGINIIIDYDSQASFETICDHVRIENNKNYRNPITKAIELCWFEIPINVTYKSLAENFQFIIEKARNKINEYEQSCLNLSKKLNEIGFNGIKFNHNDFSYQLYGNDSDLLKQNKIELIVTNDKINYVNTIRVDVDDFVKNYEKYENDILKSKKTSKKHLIRKKAEVEKVGPFYYFIDDYCEPQENDYNKKVITDFYNSLSQDDKNKFLKELDMDSFDDEIALETLIDTTTSFDKIKDQLEEFYVYKSNETVGDVQHCPLYYETYEEAAERAYSYWNAD